MSWKTRGKIGLFISLVLIILSSPNQGLLAQELAQTVMADGVVLKVHLEEDPATKNLLYAQNVLQAACDAYQEIVVRQGFNRDGYTFASASRLFVYDRDKTIDIYIANVEDPFAFLQPENDLEYKAKIFIPLDYKGYQKKYNIEEPQLELKACLTHELLHIITYFYNRNMQATYQGKIALGSDRWDWYTEGLARYFEALVGYRQEFLSCGFRKTCGKRVLVYTGGVNYFLKYPDRPLNRRKYDFALFWQYLHQNYGMDKIEQISFEFRQVDPETCSNREAMQIVARTLGVELKALLRDFSKFVYEISSLPEKKQDGLNEVYLTKLFSGPSRNSVHSICSFGFDFYELDLNQDLKVIQLNTLNGRQDLYCLFGIPSAGELRMLPLADSNAGTIKMDLSGLPQNGKMVIIFFNPTDQVLGYRISLN